MDVYYAQTLCWQVRWTGLACTVHSSEVWHSMARQTAAPQQPSSCPNKRPGMQGALGLLVGAGSGGITPVCTVLLTAGSAAVLQLPA
jgi:hypothetical protein